MRTYLVYTMAALAEIAGCFSAWAYLRRGASAFWLVPGTASLLLFTFLLARIESAAAGRTFAAYGGVYIAASLVWLWSVEGIRPDRWDLIGAVICLAGASINSAGASSCLNSLR